MIQSGICNNLPTCKDISFMFRLLILFITICDDTYYNTKKVTAQLYYIYRKLSAGSRLYSNYTLQIPY